MGEYRVPVIGETCPALINENYDYHLSGDCAEFCICSLNGLACTGRVISDPDDTSSQFFSRGKCMINQKGLERCPLYGASKETFVQVLRDKAQKELNEKLEHIQRTK